MLVQLFIQADHVNHVSRVQAYQCNNASQNCLLSHGHVPANSALFVREQRQAPNGGGGHQNMHSTSNCTDASTCANGGAFEMPFLDHVRKAITILLTTTLAARTPHTSFAYQPPCMQPSPPPPQPPEAPIKPRSRNAMCNPAVSLPSLHDVAIKKKKRKKEEE